MYHPAGKIHPGLTVLPTPPHLVLNLAVGELKVTPPSLSLSSLGKKGVGWKVGGTSGKAGVMWQLLPVMLLVIS